MSRSPKARTRRNVPELQGPFGSGTARPSVYLDYHATTPCDPRVVEAMLPFFLGSYANPSSSHAQGSAVSAEVSKARGHVAQAIGAGPGEVVFTSGATESNNLALLGSAAAAPSARRRVLVSAIEHKSVLEAARKLERSGFQLTVVPVLVDGQVDLDALAALLNDQVAVVSIQAANNEIGTIQPVAQIATIVQRHGAIFHCDAAQALGRMSIDVGAWGADLVSLSAHKCYGPKGVGALYVRGGPRAAPVEPLFAGGGQEGGLRPGTLNVPGIVGFGRACQIVVRDSAAELVRVRELRDDLEHRLLQEIPGISRNGALSRRLPGNSSISIAGVDGEAVVANLGDIALSTGSACTAGALEPSHVLTAIGLSRARAGETIRVGLGRFTSVSEIEYAAKRLIDVVASIRAAQ